ncbi:hypothetical protein PLICRDRAFT_125383 [Plicaturopsis crispa FD-325 SS-3]|nr:hypothetical protein PLICRDRAFT_125383 [Plicaturopsis crispa FD-325 SS-3]
MEDPIAALSSSPDRPRSGKTYAGRAKRKRSVVNYTEDQSEESDSQDIPAEAEASKPNTRASEESFTMPPASEEPKPVEVDLSAPAPKRARRQSVSAPKTPKTPHRKTSSTKATTDGDQSRELDSQEPTEVSKSGAEEKSMMPPASQGPKEAEASAPKRARRQSVSAPKTPNPLHRRSSSVKLKKDDESPVVSSAAKPASVRSSKRQQSLRPETPAPGDEDDDDDTASIAESSKSTFTVRRTEAARIAVLKGDPACAELEPHRVLCNRCNKWVNTGKRQTYTIRPWMNHRTRCDQQNPLPAPQTPAPVGKHPSASPAPPTSAVAARVASLTSSASSGSLCDQSAPSTEAERQAFLANDPDVEEFKPHEVVCKICKTRIKLATTRRFYLHKWLQHKQKCPTVQPTKVEWTSALANDSRVQAFSAQLVKCKVCKQDVPQDGDYDLTKWREHKAACSIADTPSMKPLSKKLWPSNKPASTLGRSLGSASSTPSLPLSRPLPSTASSSSKLFRSGTSIDGARPSASTSTSTSPPARTSEKRARDDSDVGNERPQKSQKKSEDDLPTAMDILLLPFRTFLRGFREGMGSSA